MMAVSLTSQFVMSHFCCVSFVICFLIISKVPLQFREEPIITFPFKPQPFYSSLDRHCAGNCFDFILLFISNISPLFMFVIHFSLQRRRVSSNVYLSWNDSLGNYTDQFAMNCKSVFDLLLPPALQAPFPIISFHLRSSF